jgi:hypothetical protein
MTMAAIASAVVVAVVAVLVVVKVSGGSSKQVPATATNYVPAPAPEAVVSALGAIPVSSLANAATTYTSSLSSQPRAASAAPPPAVAGSSGAHLPTFFYYGANYCPYCAAERWAIVTALSKFGTFSNLGQTTSSAVDVYPNTPTFTFYQSSYASPYINFESVETTTNVPEGNSYQPLQRPSSEQTTYLATYDSAGSIPFLSVNGRFIQASAPYIPTILAGKSMEQIAQAASDTSTAIGKAVEASAGILVKDICAATGNQPATVCSAVGG